MRNETKPIKIQLCCLYCLLPQYSPRRKLKPSHMISNSRKYWDDHEVFSGLTHTYQLKYLFTYDPTSQACSFAGAFLCQTVQIELPGAVFTSNNTAALVLHYIAFNIFLRLYVNQLLLKLITYPNDSIIISKNGSHWDYVGHNTYNLHI